MYGTHQMYRYIRYPYSPSCVCSFLFPIILIVVMAESLHAPETTPNNIIASYVLYRQRRNKFSAKLLVVLGSSSSSSSEPSGKPALEPDVWKTHTESCKLCIEENAIRRTSISNAWRNSKYPGSFNLRERAEERMSKSVVRLQYSVFGPSNAGLLRRNALKRCSSRWSTLSNRSRERFSPEENEQALNELRPVTSHS